MTCGTYENNWLLTRVFSEPLQLKKKVYLHDVSANHTWLFFNYVQFEILSINTPNSFSTPIGGERVTWGCLNGW